MGGGKLRRRGQPPHFSHLLTSVVTALGFPGEAVLVKSGGGFCGRVEVNGEVSAIFEKLDTGQRRAEEDVELFPLTGLAERPADTLRGVAKETDHGHATKQAALEEDKTGVEMADDGALDLGKPGAHFGDLREVRERGGVVAKKNHALEGTQVGESPADFFDVPCQEHVPLVGFIFEQLTLEDGQSKERGGDADQDVVVEVEYPEGLQGKRVGGTPEAFKTHAADIRAERFFAEFVIADHSVNARAELRAEFGQAFGRALERCIVGEPDEGRVAGVITVGDDEIGIAGGVDEFVEKMVVGERIPLPEEVAVKPDEKTDARTGHRIVAVIDAGLFGRARVVDVAQDKNAHGNKKVAFTLTLSPQER